MNALQLLISLTNWLIYQCKGAMLASLCCSLLVCAPLQSPLSQIDLAARCSLAEQEAEAHKDASKGYDAYMNGTVSSASCHIVLLLSATTTHLEVYFAKAVNYTLMITSVSFIQVFLLFLVVHVLTCSAAVT